MEKKKTPATTDNDGNYVQPYRWKYVKQSEKTGMILARTGTGKEQWFTPAEWEMLDA